MVINHHHVPVFGLLLVGYDSGLPFWRVAHQSDNESLTPETLQPCQTLLPGGD